MRTGIATSGPNPSGVELQTDKVVPEETTMRYDFAWSVGFCVLFLAPSAGAEILKCTDAEGNVTYSDICMRTEKRTVVDTRASSSVLDFSSIRAQKGRVFAPVAAPPVYSAPSASPPPAPSSAPFTVDRTVRPASYTAR